MPLRAEATPATVPDIPLRIKAMRRSAVVAAVVVMISILLLCIQIVLVARSLSEQRQIQQDNTGWLAASLSRDLLRLDLAFRDTQIPGVDPDLVLLRRSFDLFYSRMSVVTAQVRRMGPLMDDPDTTLAQLEMLRAYANDTAAAMDSGQLRDPRLRAEALLRLQAVETTAYDLANGILLHTSNQASLRNTQAETRITWLVALALALSMQLLIIAIIYRRLYTHAKKQELALAASLSLLRKTINATQEAIVVTDDLGKIVLVNGSAAQLGGMSIEEATGQRIDRFLHLKYTQIPPLPDRLADWAEHARFQGRIVNAMGQRIPVTGTVAAERGPDGGRVFILFLRDLTEAIRRRGEVRRARQTVVREAWRRTRFLASITHELRTPLQIADTALSLIGPDDLGALDAEHLEMARDAVTLAVAQVEETIAAALPEQSGSRPVETDFSAQALSRAVLRAAAASQAAQGWRLELVAEDLPQAFGQAQLFALSLAQLVEAALSDDQPPGRLQLSLRHTGADRIELRLRQWPSCAAPEISDRQAELLGRAKAGLAAMGATTKGAPWANAGMRIVFAAHVAPPPPRDDAALSILVVDDSPAAARVVARDLQKLGHTVMESHSGAEAVALAMLRRFDAMVLDMRMPGMDGREVAGYVRSGGESREARLIILSANVLPEEVAALHAAGVDRILTKPSRQADLAAALLPGAPTLPARAKPARPPAPEAEDDLMMARGMLGTEMHARMVEGLLDEIAAVAGAEEAGQSQTEIAGHVHRVAGSAAILGLKDLNTASCAYELALNRAAGPALEAPRQGWLRAVDQARARLDAAGFAPAR